MRRSSRLGDLIPYDPEVERTYHRRKNSVRRLDFSDSSISHQFSNPLYETDLEEGESHSVPNEVVHPDPEPEEMAGQPERSLMDYSQPSRNEIPTGLGMPTLAATNFELKPALLNMIERNQFGGNATEDPNLHISNFLQYCGTVKHAGVEPDQLRVMLFPFSLRDRARLWLNSLDATTFDSWDALSLAFYKKYYPPEKTAQMRSKITNFTQDVDETLYEAWERYKELHRMCPHHGLEKWLLVQTFYNGLNSESRIILDSAANGRFMSQTVNAGWKLIEEMANHNAQYGNTRGVVKKTGKHEVDQITLLAAQISAIN